MTYYPHGQFILAQESEIPWWWVAIIFIAFIQWLVGKIRGTDQTQSPEDEVEANRENQQPYSPPRPAQTPSGPPPVPSDPAAELRRFLEQLSGMPSAPPAPPPPPPPPPPVPAKPAAPKRPDLTPQEKEALARLEERRRKAKAEAAKMRRPISGAPATGSLRAMLRQHGSIRNAVILKEILDKPRGLRNDW